MRFHVIVNPRGGRKRAVHVWRAMRAIMDDYGVEYSVHFPTNMSVVTSLVRDLTTIDDPSEKVYLIIVGGDGTLNLVVNSIVNFSHTYIGVIPAGTGNDFARSNNISQSYETILSRIFQTDKVTHVDVGVVHYNSCFDDQGRVLHLGQKQSYFVNAMGMGFDADVVVKLNHSILTSILGIVHLEKLAYTCMAVPMLFRHRGFDIRIDTDNNSSLYHDVIFAGVLSQQYEGGGFRFCPDADSTDGINDICVVHEIKPIRLLRILPQARQGQHTQHKGIYIDRSRIVRIRSSYPVWIQLDGEAQYRTHDVTVSVEQHKLNILGIYPEEFEEVEKERQD